MSRRLISTVVEPRLFPLTIIRYVRAFIYSVKKHISLFNWLSPGATVRVVQYSASLNSEVSSLTSLYSYYQLLLQIVFNLLFNAKLTFIYVAN